MFTLLICHAQVELDLIEIADGFSAPVALNNANDGSNRLFVVERAGVVKIIEDPGTGVVLSTPFMDISNKVTSGGERGLLGLDFHPMFPDSPYCFVNYTFTEDSQLKTKVERYSISGNPNEVDTSTHVQIIEVDQPYSNHNAGDIHFGPDGYLYITMGDGGSGGDPDSLAQNTMSLLGSILRLDIDNDDFPLDQDSYYSIPPSNPFIGMAGFREELWAIGLRNPWRMSFDRSTGDLWIGDVGQSTLEEINYQDAASIGGENYGWSCKEGTLVQNFNECIPGVLTDPVFEYPRGDGFSVTGGYVYRGNSFPQLQGYYVFADYGLGNFWIINSTDPSEFTKYSLLSNISSFGESESGELYALRLSGGGLYRVVDRAICEEEIIIVNHEDSIYSSEIELTSAVPVIDTQNVRYYSNIININNPFEVQVNGVFSAYSITCMDRIILEEN